MAAVDWADRRRLPTCICHQRCVAVVLSTMAMGNGADRADRASADRREVNRECNASTKNLTDDNVTCLGFLVWHAQGLVKEFLSWCSMNHIRLWKLTRKKVRFVEGMTGLKKSVYRVAFETEPPPLPQLSISMQMSRRAQTVVADTYVERGAGRVSLPSRINKSRARCSAVQDAGDCEGGTRKREWGGKWKLETHYSKMDGRPR